MKTLTKEEHAMLKRVMKYAGKDFDTCRLTNPCITKRETIYLADAIKKICPNIMSEYELEYKD